MITSKVGLNQQAYIFMLTVPAEVPGSTLRACLTFLSCCTFSSSMLWIESASMDVWRVGEEGFFSGGVGCGVVPSIVPGGVDDGLLFGLADVLVAKPCNSNTNI